MTLIKFEPLRELDTLSERVHRLFGEFPSMDFNYSFQPKIDIYDNDSSIFVEAEIPGVRKSDIKITLEDNILTITGEKKFRDQEKSGKNFFRSERSFGTFVRSFTLPDEVNPDKVDAHFEDGLLRIAIEKAGEKKANEKFIEIK
jgi:HSP20 family protein